MIEHVLQVAQDLDRLDPDHPIPLGIQPYRSIAVLDHAFTMELAVHFHDQLGGRAVEVDDVRADGHLAPESRSQAAASDLAPEQALWQRHVAAELAGAV